MLPDEAVKRCQLDRQTRALVQLSALIADDAPTASLRWAADVAATAGADDTTLVRVLAAAARATGSAQTAKTAPRLALALDVDIDLEGWDGT
jgi:hypothetical protein